MFEHLIRGDDDHAYIMDVNNAYVPDVACHQMHDAQSEEQWFGVGMYATWGPWNPSPLDFHVLSMSYKVDGPGMVTLTNPDKWHAGYDSPETHAIWSAEVPNTGPTLCLRNDLSGFLPWQQEFAAGWMEQAENPADPMNVWLAKGTIHE
jgi:hypothetical protein